MITLPSWNIGVGRTQIVWNDARNGENEVRLGRGIEETAIREDA